MDGLDVLGHVLAFRLEVGA
jgi:hypothetical protein